LDRFLERTAREAFLHLAERRFIDTARVARVAIVPLVTSLVARDLQLARVDNDDEITGVDVRSEFRLVLAAKTVCHFAGDTPENLIRRVNHVPFTRNLMGFCGKRLHDRSKKIAAPNVFFPACSVRIEARAGSPWFFLRGRGCGKALNYKGICRAESKFAAGSAGIHAIGRPTARFVLLASPENAIGEGRRVGEKKPELVVRV